MNRLINIGIVTLSFLFTIPAFAQQTNNRQIDITYSKLYQKGDSMHIDLTIDTKKLSLDKNSSFTLTPVLIGRNGQRVELLPILINGAARHKVYLRSIALSPNQDSPYMAVKLNKSGKHPLNYTQSAPFKEWMNEAHLDIREESCGCGGSAPSANQYTVANYVPVVKEPEPQLVEKPIQKVAKSYKEEWDIYVSFPVNKTDILADYMDNLPELLKIDSLFNSLRAENITVKQINIVGYASPEGSLSNNERLSKGRAESIRRYIIEKNYFPEEIHTVEYGGENWTGLVEALKQSNIAGKSEVLRIIESTEDITHRKNKLRTIDNGMVYREMLAGIYPRLRKVILQGDYEVMEEE